MKKLLSLILAALMLASCTTGTDPDDIPDDARDETAGMPAAEFEIIPNYLSTSLTQTAELAEYRDELECGMTTTAPRGADGL